MVENHINTTYIGNKTFNGILCVSGDYALEYDNQLVRKKDLSAIGTIAPIEYEWMGDGTITPIALPSLGLPGTASVWANLGDQSVGMYLLRKKTSLSDTNNNYHYAEDLDSNGYLVSITPRIQWVQGVQYIIFYNST